MNCFYGSEAGRWSLGNGETGGNTYLGTAAGRGVSGSGNTGVYNTFVGFSSGQFITSGTSNTFVGTSSGELNTTGFHNVFIGSHAGRNNSTGFGNVFVGVEAGLNNAEAINNVFVGGQSGQTNTTGVSNTFLGAGSGQANTSGSNNVLLGFQAGNTIQGFGNVIVGAQAGSNASGAGNVFLGHQAGKNEAGDNKLYIANSDTATPLIYGDFSANKIGIGGMSGFPTTAGSVNVSAYSLFVKGGILTEEVRVQLQSGWADYVFAKDYSLPTLTEVEKFINDNGHLPNVPSAKQVQEDGIGLGDMARIQQEKIEELTLYTIQQDKQLKEQNNKLEQQQKEINELKAIVRKLAEIEQ
jgi:hypothetical protein